MYTLQPANPTFLGAPAATNLSTLAADVAIIGAPYGLTYDPASPLDDSSAAPAAIRRQSLRDGRFLHHHNLDFGGDIFNGRTVRIVDCGDILRPDGAYAEYQTAITTAVGAILARGALPCVLGGNDAIPIPVFRAYANQPPFCLVQFDAHLDWRHEVNGLDQGYSSPMRRASELPWITGMAQLGIRGTGSARHQEVADSLAYGSVHIPARTIHEQGVAAALAQLPPAARYFVTFDLDVMDPAIAPGVGAPAFGGLTYYQATDLLRGVAARGTIVGCNFVELAPALDLHDRTALLTARLLLNLLGAMAHAGQLGG